MIPDALAADGDLAVDVRRSPFVSAAGDDPRMRLELDGVQARGHGWREQCATTIQAAGGYVLVVETVLPSRAAGLSSCYLSNLAGDTAVSHLRRAPGATAAFSQRVLTGGMAGATHARACLLDHAAELQAFLQAAGEPNVSVEISEEALTRAAGVWREPQP